MEREIANDLIAWNRMIRIYQSENLLHGLMQILLIKVQLISTHSK